MYDKVKITNSEESRNTYKEYKIKNCIDIINCFKRFM